MFSSRNGSGQVIKNGAVVTTFRESVYYSNLSSLPPSGKFSDGITTVENVCSLPPYLSKIAVLSMPPPSLIKEEVVSKAVVYSLNLFLSPESKDLILSNEAVIADVQGILFVSSILLTLEGKYRGKVNKFLLPLGGKLTGEILNEFYLKFSVPAWKSLRSKSEKDISNVIGFLFFVINKSLNKVSNTHVVEKESTGVICKNYKESMKNIDPKIFFNSAVDRCITDFFNIN